MGYALPNYLSFIMQWVDKVVFDCKIETDRFGIAGQRADVHVGFDRDTVFVCSDCIDENCYGCDYCDNYSYRDYAIFHCFRYAQ